MKEKMTAKIIPRQKPYLELLYYYTRLMAAFPGQPGYAGARNVKQAWI